ncbi:hypothetical protein MLD38_029088 [Melastoma candidum]|uniref:Uncharacterized protein n=1 Tax=Melastoma candidum TaxID=119954 RepID=A0ACB9N4D6_9MYRT|nr:hypothetical protein MLD38_029088 [Melastoma candidum]
MSSESPSELASRICHQIAAVFSAQTTHHPPALEVLTAELTALSLRKGRAFLYGVGREGLMMRAFCMRLFHLGLPVHLVFDMTTPPIGSEDLLIASAGPGGFSTVDAICGVARSAGARVLLLTAQPEGGSSLRYATAVAHVPAQTMADDGREGRGGSRQVLPMGSVYEGALFEMAVYKLGEALGETPEAIRCRHTNLE